jgi:acyl-CoA reductase-like NAD-dependent aldehyde dehydrogenase
MPQGRGKSARNTSTDAVSKGATLLLTGGNSAGRAVLRTHRSGDTYRKTAVLLKEETFGPLAPLLRFHSDAEVDRPGQRHEYGLASYFYSPRPRHVWHIAEQLEYGMVGVNTGLISNEVAPFGGIKRRVWAAKVPNTASKITWNSNTCAWASKPGGWFKQRGHESDASPAFQTVNFCGRERHASRSSHAGMGVCLARQP